MKIPKIFNSFLFKIYFNLPNFTIFELNTNILRKNGGSLSFGRNCYISKYTDIHVIGGEITIQDNFFCNKGCTLSSRKLIKIGNGVRFGEYVSIYDHNHNHDLKTSSFHDSYSIGQVVIGDNVWVCRGAIITKDVVIGKNSIIGPNVVVREDIPEGTKYI